MFMLGHVSTVKRRLNEVDHLFGRVFGDGLFFATGIDIRSFFIRIFVSATVLSLIVKKNG
jgi:hypothetical protein